MKTLTVAAVLIYLTIPQVLEGRSLSKSEIQALQKTFTINSSLDVSFKQTQTRLRSDAKLKETRGKAYFASNPPRFRWAVDDPKHPQQFIYNGIELYDYKPDEKTVYVYQYGTKLTQDLDQIVGAILNFSALLKSYDITTANDTGDVINLELVPKTSRDITQIDVTWGKKDNFIRAIKLNYPGQTDMETKTKRENYVLYEFSNPQFGKTSPAMFKFMKPKDVKKIEVQ